MIVRPQKERIMENGGLFSEDALTEETPDGSSASQPATTPNMTNRQNRVERSCLLCHRKKIRCNKKSPCSSCVRAGVLCCYPGPERVPRRRQKTTVADVAARLARLERTIIEVSNDSNDSNDSPPNFTNDQLTTVNASAADNAPADEATPAGHSANDEVLVQNGYSSRYFNEFLLSRVLEEEEEIKSILAMSSSNSHRNTTESSFNLGGILFGLSASSTENQGFHLSKWQSMQLWQVFVNNVDPLTKILHIPTTQIIMFSAINDPSLVAEDVHPLLFAIYFAATTSLELKDVENILGCDKSTALNNFKQGLEQSLAQADLLDSPSLRSIQALALFLMCISAYNAGRSLWILNGLAIRSAQSIGMHRDGTHFNLSPFDAEMRRRLWWRLTAKDTRAAEDHGISVINFDPSSDISFPSNLDDSELYPTMKELPVVQSKYSEMTFSLIVIETGHAIQRLSQMASTMNAQPSESVRKETIDNVTAKLEGYVKHCNSDIPVQRASLLLARIVVRKLDLVSRQQWLNRSNPEKGASHATEENIVNACEILELNLQIQSDDILKGFRWSFETYPPYHLLLYVLWHLCLKPVGPSVERAWTAVNGTFAEEEAYEQVASCRPGSKWAVLKMLKEKAMRIRISASGGELTSNAQEELGGILNVDYLTEGFVGAGNGTFEDEINWGTDNFYLQPYEF